MKKKNQTIFIPTCNVHNCKGVLKIKMKDGFTVDYECEKNKIHKGKNICYLTFDKKYLIEKKISKKKDCIPSEYNNEISNLNSEIKKKSKIYKKFIQSANLYIEKIKQKINKIQKVFNEEINFLKKIAFSADFSYDNATCFSNIKNLNTSIKLEKNKKISKFNNDSELEAEINRLTKLIQDSENSNNNNNQIFHEVYRTWIIKKSTSYKSFLLHKITDEYYLNFYQELNGGKFISLNNISKNQVKIYDSIYSFHSISHSSDNKEIYACNSNSNRVMIFNLSLEKLQLSKNIIICDIISGNYNKCIEISNNNNKYLAIADNENTITIWSKTPRYTKFKTILMGVETNDLLQVDENYFIGSQPNNKIITFFNTNNFEVEKTLKGINSRRADNSLLLLKKYIIINCLKGIHVINKKTKEVMQYIEFFYDQEIITINGNFFFLLSYYNDKDKKLTDLENNDFYLGLRVRKMEMIHGYFQENGFQDIYGGTFKNHLYLPYFNYFGNKLYIWDIHDYTLEEFNTLDEKFIES